MENHAITIAPAYGRDYRSAKAALKDWHEGKDFMAQTYVNSSYISKSEVKLGQTLHIRYNQLRSVIIHTCSEECKTQQK